MAKQKFIPRPKESARVIRKRWTKKRDNIENLANNVQKLRYNISIGLKNESDNEKNFLTCLVIAIMLRSFERVGNEASKNEKNHVGVSGLRKNQVTIIGNKIILEYIGKSGVEHEKMFSDAKIAKALKIAKKKSPDENVFTTSKGFKIKASRVNNFLSDFGVTSKDARAFGANNLLTKKLSELEPEETEVKRKRQFNKVARYVAKKVGHGLATLKKHYLIPEIEPNFVEEGKVIEVDDVSKYNNGGTVKADDKNVKVNDDDRKRINKPKHKRDGSKLSITKQGERGNAGDVKKVTRKVRANKNKVSTGVKSKVEKEESVEDIKIQIMRLQTKAFKMFAGSPQQKEVIKKIDELYIKLGEKGGNFKDGGEVTQQPKIVVHNNTNSASDKDAQKIIMEYLKNINDSGHKKFYDFLKKSKQTPDDYEAIFYVSKDYHDKNSSKFYSNKIIYQADVSDAYKNALNYDDAYPSFIRIYKKGNVKGFAATTEFDLFGDWDGEKYDEKGYLKKELKEQAISKLKKELFIDDSSEQIIDKSKLGEMKNGGDVSFDNFHIDTIANYISIEESEIPNRNPDFISDTGSKYWYEDNYVIRRADHWGEMGTCTWLLGSEPYLGLSQGKCLLSDFKKQNDDNKYLFGGEIDFNDEKLILAKKLSLEGASVYFILKETGWFVNPFDKMWRYEIDDSEMELIANFEEIKKNINKLSNKTIKYKLTEIIKHDELFEKYPFLKNVWIKFIDDKNEPICELFVYPDSKKIIINYNLYEKNKLGGTPEIANYLIKRRRGSSEKRALHKEGILSDIYEGGIGDDARRAILCHEIQHAIQIKHGFAAGYGQEQCNEETFKKEVEKGLTYAGEIESKAVEERLLMNKDERLNYLPFYNYKIIFDDVIVEKETPIEFSNGGVIIGDITITDEIDTLLRENYSLIKDVDYYSYLLGKFPKGDMGLISDSIKKSSEFIEAKSNFDLAFFKLKDYNISEKGKKISAFKKKLSVGKRLEIKRHYDSNLEKGGYVNPYAVCTSSIGKTEGTTKITDWSKLGLEKYESCVLDVKDKMTDGGEVESEFNYVSVYNKQGVLVGVLKINPDNAKRNIGVADVLGDSIKAGYDFLKITKEQYDELKYKVDTKLLEKFQKDVDAVDEFRKGGEITSDDKKELYNEWKNLVNMPYSEIKNFYYSDEGKEAGLSNEEANELGIHSGRESAKWIMKMKKINHNDWTPEMWLWCKRQISFIKRMSGNQGGLFDENGNKTRKYTSLLIWGHDPLKS